MSTKNREKGAVARCNARKEIAKEKERDAKKVRDANTKQRLKNKATVEKESDSK